jgi:hypothetical protein
VIRVFVEHIWDAGTGNTFGAVAPIVLFIQVAVIDVEEVAQKLTAFVLRTLAILRVELLLSSLAVDASVFVHFVLAP